MYGKGWPPHPWEDIERRYRESVAFDAPWLSPMADLTGRIIRSGIGRSLHGLTSMYRLRCMMHDLIYPDEPALVVAPAPDAKYTLIFEHPWSPLKDDWQATYDAASLPSAFSRFLKRVGWVPEGHPAHKVLLGEA